MKQFNSMPLYSSASAKTLYYRPDGSGRDGYIEINQGGLTVEKQCHKFPEFGRDNTTIYISLGQFPKERRHTDHKPSLGRKAINYRANGSGRDSYIL
jgi:hypothetical protein